MSRQHGLSSCAAARRRKEKKRKGAGWDFLLCWSPEIQFFRFPLTEGSKDFGAHRNFHYVSHMRGADFFLLVVFSLLSLSLSSINMVDDEKYYKFYDRKRLTPNGSVISNLLSLRPFIVYFWCCWGARPATRASLNINAQWLLSNLPIGIMFWPSNLAVRVSNAFTSTFIPNSHAKHQFLFLGPVSDRQNISTDIFKDLGTTMPGEAHC